MRTDGQTDRRTHRDEQTGRQTDRRTRTSCLTYALCFARVRLAASRRRIIVLTLRCALVSGLPSTISESSSSCSEASSQPPGGDPEPAPCGRNDRPRAASSSRLSRVWVLGFT
jgi:hypothetical protein